MLQENRLLQETEITNVTPFRIQQCIDADDAAARDQDLREHASSQSHESPLPVPPQSRVRVCIQGGGCQPVHRGEVPAQASVK